MTKTTTSNNFNGIDFDIRASAEGSAIDVANSYRTRRPNSKNRAPLKPVPSHLRVRRDKLPVADRVQKPAVEKPSVPDWLGEFLSGST